MSTKVPAVLARVADGPARAPRSSKTSADCGCECWISPSMKVEVFKMVLKYGKEEIYTTCAPHCPPLEEGPIIGIDSDGEQELTKEEYDEIIRENGGIP